MPVYRYRAQGRDGRARQGVVTAVDPQDAQRRLLGRGWQVERVQSARLERAAEIAHAPAKRRALPLVLVALLVGAAVAFAILDPLAWRAQLGLP